MLAQLFRAKNKRAEIVTHYDTLPFFTLLPLQQMEVAMKTLPSVLNRTPSNPRLRRKCLALSGKHVILIMLPELRKMGAPDL